MPAIRRALALLLRAPETLARYTLTASTGPSAFAMKSNASAMPATLGSADGEMTSVPSGRFSSDDSTDAPAVDAPSAGSTATTASAASARDHRRPRLRVDNDVDSPISTPPPG